MRKLSKKALAASTAAVFLAGSGVAYAYWTNSGTGSGTAATGTTSALVVTQNGAPAGLAPGSAAQPLDFTVSNPGTGAVQINGVTIAFAATAGCVTGDFGFTQPSFTALIIPAGGSKTFTSGAGGDVAATGAAINMINTASNQDACKSASVNVSYTSS